jgi:hypothetical protein
MGRPRRSDKEQLQSLRGNGSTAAGSSYNPPRTQTTSGVYSPTDDTWPGHDLNDDTLDPPLPGVTVQYLESFDFSLPAEARLEDDSLNIPAEHYLDTCSSLDASLGHQSINSIVALPVTDAEAMAIDPTATVINGDNCFIQMRQETMQELSDLNMQFYQQLSAIGPMASKHTNVHPGFRGSTAMPTPPDGSNTLSDAVVFMMHGLQTYHRLLVKILGSTTPTHVAAASGSRDKHLNSSTVTASLLGPAEGLDGEGPVRCRRSDAGGPPPHKRIRSDGSSAEPNAAMLHDSSDSSQNSTVVDLPTSLLLLSCHTNLMHLCRDALAAIRVALLATHRQITLLTISILHIDETAIPPDPELQVIVLTQAVIRLTDRIGRLLGYSDDCEGYSGSERGEAEPRSSAISPQLVHLVLRWEAGENGPADRGGMEALREEIRKLHEIVYQPI